MTFPLVDVGHPEYKTDINELKSILNELLQIENSNDIVAALIERYRKRIAQLENPLASS